MHEFSLAQNILKIVEENVSDHNVSQVSELTLDIGSLACIELQALTTAIEIIKQGTILEKAVVNYHVIQAKAICKSCDYCFEPVEIFDMCPKCSQYGIQIVSGKELIVKSIVAE